MLKISTTDEWRSMHPGTLIGLLELTGVKNTGPSPDLDTMKRQTEALLRKRCNGFSRQEFLALPVMAAYDQYYRRFNNTYHVLLQVESIVLKGKNLPNVSPLVDACFAAEIETLVLTAGHDASKLLEPISFDAAREGDQMVSMNGKGKVLHTGDMIMRDANGVCCSVLAGQDNRSPITQASTHVLYVAYVPIGISAQIVSEHLRKIETNIRLFSPGAVVEQLHLLTA